MSAISKFTAQMQRASIRSNTASHHTYDDGSEAMSVQNRPVSFLVHNVSTSQAIKHKNASPSRLKKETSNSLGLNRTPPRSRVSKANTGTNRSNESTNATSPPHSSYRTCPGPHKPRVPHFDLSANIENANTSFHGESTRSTTESGIIHLMDERKGHAHANNSAHHQVYTTSKASESRKGEENMDLTLLKSYPPAVSPYQPSHLHQTNSSITKTPNIQSNESPSQLHYLVPSPGVSPIIMPENPIPASSDNRYRNALAVRDSAATLLVYVDALAQRLAQKKAFEAQRSQENTEKMEGEKSLIRFDAMTQSPQIDTGLNNKESPFSHLPSQHQQVVASVNEAKSSNFMRPPPAPLPPALPSDVNLFITPMQAFQVSRPNSGLGLRRPPSRSGSAVIDPSQSFLRHETPRTHAHIQYHSKSTEYVIGNTPIQVINAKKAQLGYASGRSTPQFNQQQGANHELSASRSEISKHIESVESLEDSKRSESNHSQNSFVKSETNVSETLKQQNKDRQAQKAALFFAKSYYFRLWRNLARESAQKNEEEVRKSSARRRVRLRASFAMWRDQATRTRSLNELAFPFVQNRELNTLMSAFTSWNLLSKASKYSMELASKRRIQMLRRSMNKWFWLIRLKLIGERIEGNFRTKFLKDTICVWRNSLYYQLENKKKVDLREEALKRCVLFRQRLLQRKTLMVWRNSAHKICLEHESRYQTTLLAAQEHYNNRLLTSIFYKLKSFAAIIKENTYNAERFSSKRIQRSVLNAWRQELRESRFERAYFRSRLFAHWLRITRKRRAQGAYVKLIGAFWTWRQVAAASVEESMEKRACIASRRFALKRCVSRLFQHANNAPLSTTLSGFHNVSTDGSFRSMLPNATERTALETYRKHSTLSRGLLALTQFANRSRLSKQISQQVSEFQEFRHSWKCSYVIQKLYNNSITRSSLRGSIEIFRDKRRTMQLRHSISLWTRRLQSTLALRESAVSLTNVSHYRVLFTYFSKWKNVFLLCRANVAAENIVIDKIDGSIGSKTVRKDFSTVESVVDEMKAGTDLNEIDKEETSTVSTPIELDFEVEESISPAVNESSGFKLKEKLEIMQQNDTKEHLNTNVSKDVYLIPENRGIKYDEEIADYVGMENEDVDVLQEAISYQNTLLNQDLGSQTEYVSEDVNQQGQEKAKCEVIANDKDCKVEGVPVDISKIASKYSLSTGIQVTNHPFSDPLLIEQQKTEEIEVKLLLKNEVGTQTHKIVVAASPAKLLELPPQAKIASTQTPLKTHLDRILDKTTQLRETIPAYSPKEIEIRLSSPFKPTFPILQNLASDLQTPTRISSITERNLIDTMSPSFKNIPKSSIISTMRPNLRSAVADLARNADIAPSRAAKLGTASLLDLRAKAVRAQHRQKMWLDLAEQTRLHKRHLHRGLGPEEVNDRADAESYEDIEKQFSDETEDEDQNNVYDYSSFARHSEIASPDKMSRRRGIIAASKAIRYQTDVMLERERKWNPPPQRRPISRALHLDASFQDNNGTVENPVEFTLHRNDIQTSENELRLGRKDAMAALFAEKSLQRRIFVRWKSHTEAVTIGITFWKMRCIRLQQKYLSRWAMLALKKRALNALVTRNRSLRLSKAVDVWRGVLHRWKSEPEAAYKKLILNRWRLRLRRQMNLEYAYEVVCSKQKYSLLKSFLKTWYIKMLNSIENREAEPVEDERIPKEKNNHLDDAFKSDPETTQSIQPLFGSNKNDTESDPLSFSGTQSGDAPSEKKDEMIKKCSQNTSAVSMTPYQENGDESSNMSPQVQSVSKATNKVPDSEYTAVVSDDYPCDMADNNANALGETPFIYSSGKSLRGNESNAVHNAPPSLQSPDEAILALLEEEVRTGRSIWSYMAPVKQVFSRGEPSPISISVDQLKHSLGTRNEISSHLNQSDQNVDEVSPKDATEVSKELSISRSRSNSTSRSRVLEDSSPKSFKRDQLQGDAPAAFYPVQLKLRNSNSPGTKPKLKILRSRIASQRMAATPRLPQSLGVDHINKSTQSSRGADAERSFKKSTSNADDNDDDILLDRQIAKLEKENQKLNEQLRHIVG